MDREGAMMELTASQNKAKYKLMMTRFGSLHKHVAVELTPAGRSVVVTFRVKGWSIDGSQAMVVDSEWLIGPRGKVSKP